jgi:hypothetical protein
MREQIALTFALTDCIGKKRLFTELVVTGQKESVIDDTSLCRDRQTVQLILVAVAIKIAILHLEDVRNHGLIVRISTRSRPEPHPRTRISAFSKLEPHLLYGKWVFTNSRGVNFHPAMF